MNNKKQSFTLNLPQVKVPLLNMAKCVNRSTVLPILECLYVSVENGVCTFTASDLESTIEFRHVIDIDTSVKFSFCIDAMLFTKFLKNSLSETVSVTIADKFVCLEGGGFKVKIPSENAADFPVTPYFDKSALMIPLMANDCKKIVTAIQFVSHDDLRPSITGVSFKKVNGKIEIAATDARCLYWDDIAALDETKKFNQFIIGKKSCQLFAENFKGQVNYLFPFENHVVFACPNFVLYCRKIDAKYPDYEKIFAAYELNFYLKRKQLISFIKLAEAFVSKSTYLLYFKVSQDSIQLSGGDMDYSIDFDYSIPVYNANIKFMPFEFGGNIRFLKKIIMLNNDEYVKINNSQISTKSMVIDDKFLIMPLMVHQ